MTPSLSIHPEDGSVRIDGLEFVIIGGVSKLAATAELQHLFRRATSLGNGYEWLSFHKVAFGGQPCGFALGFQIGRLSDLHFSVMLPDAEMQDGWPTRAAIDGELSFVRRELSRQLGKEVADSPVRFKWGSVWSVFDPKGFQASSGLRYGA